MKLSTWGKRVAIAGSMLALVACNSESVDAVEANELVLETDMQIVSYGIGMNVGGGMKAEVVEFDIEAVIAGIRDAYAGEEPRLSEEVLQTAFQNLQAQAQADAEAAANAALTAGVDFLEANSEKEGVTVTESGLQYEVLVDADSAESPAATSVVKVHYHGTLIDGTVFDSSVDRGEPVEFPLNGVIPGWTEGVQLMTEGDKFRFVIPSELAYGPNAPSPTIPANAVLIFEVELLEIVAQ